jgi:autotransporter-associated beta strand protein
VTDGGTLAYDLSSAATFSGIISGTGGLTQNGSGTLTLGSANTYTGATNINSGTLAEGTVNSIGTTSAVTVASSANPRYDPQHHHRLARRRGHRRSDLWADHRNQQHDDDVFRHHHQHGRGNPERDRHPRSYRGQ